MTPPPVSETAATTGDSAAFRELVLKACTDLGFYGLRADNPDAMASLASLVANASRLGSVVDNAELRAEILRLRAENERLTKLQAPKLTCATCRREQPYHSMYRCFQCEAWFDHGHMASHLAHTHNVGESRELVALRSELAAATRERETPPDQYAPDTVKWEIFRDRAEALRCSEHWEESEARAELAAMRARYADNPGVRLVLVRSTTSRSRVSDNG